MELPEGTNLEKTAEKLTEIENIVKSNKEVEHMVTDLGRIGDLNIVQIWPVWTFN